LQTFCVVTRFHWTDLYIQSFFGRWKLRCPQICFESKNLQKAKHFLCCWKWVELRIRWVGIFNERCLHCVWFCPFAWKRKISRHLCQNTFDTSKQWNIWNYVTEEKKYVLTCQCKVHSCQVGKPQNLIFLSLLNGKWKSKIWRNLYLNTFDNSKECKFWNYVTEERCTYMLVQGTLQYIKVYTHVKMASLDLPLYQLLNTGVSGWATLSKLLKSRHWRRCPWQPKWPVDRGSDLSYRLWLSGKPTSAATRYEGKHKHEGFKLALMCIKT